MLGRSETIRCTGSQGTLADAVQLPDELVDRVLTHWPVARLAVLDTGGRPRVMPIVFARVSGYLWSAIDGKPKGDAEPARLRYVRRHPLVELVIDDYTDDWQCLWWIRVDGLAQVVQPPDPERDPDTAPVIQALRRKYPQYGQTPLLRDPPTLLVIRPDRIRSWCASHDAFRALSAVDLGS